MQFKQGIHYHIVNTPMTIPSLIANGFCLDHSVEDKEDIKLGDIIQIHDYTFGIHESMSTDSIEIAQGLGGTFEHVKKKSFEQVLSESVPKKHNTDGGKTDFYNLSGSLDLDDLSDLWELRSDEFNCIKAIVGIAQERKIGATRHSGTSTARDLKKLMHYANRINNRINNGQS